MNASERLKRDIQSGEITALELIYTDNPVIEDNRYAQMYLTPRRITRFDDNKFYMDTIRTDLQTYYEPVNGDWRQVDVVEGYDMAPKEESEAYYSAFYYYDGDTIRHREEIPNAVYQRDRFKKTIYKVRR